jgi:signal transduction histidine kinase
LTSRFVTRRIQQLAAEAQRTQGGVALLERPFTERGHDEISGLARAMNQMRERNLELLAAMESRDRQRREWIAQVSHDLRTPLTALRASLERAERQLQRQESGSHELRASIEAAKLDGSRVVTLAEDLLEIARLDADPRLVREPVPPGELARSAVTSLRPMAKEGNLEIELAIESGLPIIEADGRRLMRAMENLLANAMQHARSRVLLQVRREGGLLRFEVSDDGPGFPVENGRVDLTSLASRLSRDDSTGLGLQVALRVAEAHGGRLEADNLPTGGAFIALGLPLPPEL